MSVAGRAPLGRRLGGHANEARGGHAMGGWDAPWHWVIIALLVIALFGYKKLPDASRSLGRSLRIFKTEIKGMSEDDKKRAEAREVATPPAVESAQPTT